MPRVSVVMPSFNHAPFVREAIESVRTQSYQDFELVITDDGSRDGTVAAIQSIDDPRVRLQVLAENQGACVAMNDAITRAEGEYVAILNSDDYFLPGKLERQVAFLDAHPEVGAVFGLPHFVDERGQLFRDPGHLFWRAFATENRTRSHWLKEFFYMGNCLCHPTVMIRKACYDRVGLFDPLLRQLPDWDMWIRLCRTFEIHVLPDKLTAFRVLDRERNVSAPSREALARSAWETAAVLRHYAGFADGELREIFGWPADGASRPSPKIELALAAIRLDRAGYSQFGLALLRDCLRHDWAGFSAGEYFELVGKVDPYAAEFCGREYRWLRQTRVLSSSRRIYFWIRRIMLRWLPSRARRP
jgi:glycosyltransferase involved in cell wall biosynthesis